MVLARDDRAAAKTGRGEARWRGRPSNGGNRRSRGASDLNPSSGEKASRLTGAGGSGRLSCEKPKEGVAPSLTTTEMDSDGGGGRRGVRWEDGMGRNGGALERRWREDSRFGRAGQE
jgi:hypothetical protein